jgi:uncharacterized membrane protein
MALKRIRLEDARVQLARIWFIGAGLAFAVLSLQSILGRKYTGHLQEVWSWFVPTVAPSLGLMLGVIGADAMRDSDDKRNVKQTFYRLARGVSIAYLVTLSATILLEPLSTTPSLELFVMSNYWLAPVQALAVGAIGVLFAAQETPSTSTESTTTKAT